MYLCVSSDDKGGLDVDSISVSSGGDPSAGCFT